MYPRMKIRMLERKNRVLFSNFAISVLAAVSFFRFAALLSYRRIFSFANSQKLFVWYRMLLLNIYVTDLMQTCYIHVQQYQIITFAVYRGRLLLARSHFHADHAGWP